MNRMIALAALLLFAPSYALLAQPAQSSSALGIGEQGYYEAPGVNVMVFDDFYPEGHQGGITIVQRNVRLAANGDIRLEPSPGQWAPVPAIGPRQVDKQRGIITVELWYPDSSKDRKGFNPIVYPDLRFHYSIRTVAEGSSIRVIVDLQQPLPKAWADKAGFILELFPGEYFGMHYFMDGKPGLFPRQANGPMERDRDGTVQSVPMAVGRQLTVAPGDPAREMNVVSKTGDLQLLDERGLHNNGWFALRTTIPSGPVKNAVEWIITPSQSSGWRSIPVIQLSQMGYHPKQDKFAVIELDKRTERYEPIRLVKITDDSAAVVRSDNSPDPWGNFLRFKYLRFDFSSVAEEGLYEVRYGDRVSHQFEIRNDIYTRNVWQPTLEVFLPVQMCHIKVKDRYKTWHGLCHMDDARMAPVNHNHFDGYYQHESTLTSFASGDHVPGLNIGGWHDAGDYDLRVESQAETVYKLALAYELFGDRYDDTSIDEDARVAELHRPDGKPDLLQQVEHGVLSIVGGFDSMGRLYRGIICPTLQQYVHLGDASTMTDNLIFKPAATDPILNRPLPEDDRWVFTEKNPRRELNTAQVLAAASRVLHSYNPPLAARSLAVAETLYSRNLAARGIDQLNAAAELFLTISGKEYGNLLLASRDTLSAHIIECSEVIGRVTGKLHDRAFTASMSKAVKAVFARVATSQQENPYGVPYRPYIWGAGWDIQAFGVKQLFLHMGFPKLFPATYAWNALNFVLGCHPGENTASFASGVGVRSLTVAYGTNRDEWSYIPGGVASGTALIRPDLPELKTWPYFWQQAEYVMGGGATDFLLLAMAADHLLNTK